MGKFVLQKRMKVLAVNVVCTLMLGYSTEDHCGLSLSLLCVQLCMLLLSLDIPTVFNSCYRYSAADTLTSPPTTWLSVRMWLSIVYSYETPETFRPTLIELYCSMLLHSLTRATGHCACVYVF